MTHDPRPDEARVGGPSQEAGSASRRSGLESSTPSSREAEEGASALTRTAPQRRNPVLHFLREIVVIGVTALLISFLIKTFLVQAFWIPSGSMESTLIYGDRVLVSKIQAGPMEVERGDIIVFEDPGGWLPPSQAPDRGPIMNVVMDAAKFIGVVPEGESHHLIKRVIGVGGDHVVCCDDQQRITINGEPLNETYLYPGDEPSLENFDVTVPADHYWMMGDHRSYSRDSRAHDDGTGTAGSVPADRVVGQAFTLVWPFDRFEVFRNPGEVFGSIPAPEGQ